MTVMNMNQIAKEIAKREGRKSNANIGDIREILGILCDIFHEDRLGLLAVRMMENGNRRAKRKKK
jgi:hypothetical protein